jgi:hypothetical protein
VIKLSKDTVVLKINFVEGDKYNLLAIADADNPDRRMHISVPKGSSIYEALKFMGETSVHVLECFTLFDLDEDLNPESIPGYSEDNQ